MSNYVMTKSELYHHGIKGQKWGIRRFQNEDGSYTAEGKERRRADGSEKHGISKSTVKKVATAAAILGTAALAAAYVKKHPDKIARVISKASKFSVKSLSKKAIDKGKHYAKRAVEEAVAGVKEGVRNAPKKVARAAAEGAAIIAANKLVDSLIGQKQNKKLIKAYNAYNKKNKISTVPKWYDEDDDD